jgi:sugar/nucleoside kinase (ribokinase family)
MASVGDDVFGRGILDLIEQHDPSLTRFITVQKEQPSSYTIVLAPEKVDRIFLYGAGANTSFSSYTMNYGVLDQAKILHLGYPTTLPRLYENDGEDLVRLMRLAKVRGVITSLDTTLPDPQSGSGRVNWQSILRRTLPHTDIFIPSIEEIVFMLRRHDYDRWGGIVLPHITRSYLIELANEILDMGAAVAGFKLGGLGVFIKTAILGRIEVLTSIGANHKQWADITEYQPAFDVDVVGTTGAGDAAYAVF